MKLGKRQKPFKFQKIRDDSSSCKSQEDDKFLLKDEKGSTLENNLNAFLTTSPNMTKPYSTAFNFKKQIKKLITTIQDRNPNLFVSRALKKQLFYQHTQKGYEQWQVQQQHALLRHYNNFKKRREKEMATLQEEGFANSEEEACNLKIREQKESFLDE